MTDQKTPDVDGRTATEVQAMQDKSNKGLQEILDGSKLPPITGDMKLAMAGDGMSGSLPPPITGDMAVTEPKDMLARRRPAEREVK